MHPTLTHLLEDLRSGLLWVSNDGRVRYANTYATKKTGLGAGSQVYEPELLHAIKVAVDRAPSSIVNVVGMPPDFGKPAPTLECKALPGFSKDDAFVMITADRFSDRAIAYENLMQVLYHDLSDPVEIIRGQIDSIKNDMPPVYQKHLTPIVDNLVELVDLLDRIHKLSDVWTSNKLIDNERIELWNLVQTVWEHVRPFAQRRGITVVFRSLQDVQDLPTIYGSKFWLTKAIEECLQMVVRMSKDGASITVEHKQLGPRALINIHNSSGFDKNLSNSTVLGSIKKDVASRARQNFIGVELAQHILAIHGGSLREDKSDNQFIIDVPTGAPMNMDAAQLDIQQAQRYAEDLAALMARSRKKN